MIILALDLGKFNTMCCFFDTETQKPEYWTAATTRVYLTSILKSRAIDWVVMEACGPSGWISDLCRELGLKSLVCSTNEEAWRWKNVKRKTDRDDAHKLARLAMLGQLKPVHVPQPAVREHRLLIKYRKTLDGRINRVKNAIRSLFANHGIEIPRGNKAWTVAGRQEIDGSRKLLADCGSQDLWKGELDLELTQLDSLTKEQRGVERRLDTLAEADERIQRIKTIPGVGLRTAEVLATTIDDPHRFQNGRQVSAYLGLVPAQYQSGETDRNGRITRRGSRLVRTILLECAWCSLRYNEWAKRVHTRISGHSKTRRKKAGIALARKIAVVAWALLRDGKGWDPVIMAETTNKLGHGRLAVAPVTDQAAAASTNNTSPSPKIQHGDQKHDTTKQETIHATKNLEHVADASDIGLANEAWVAFQSSNSLGGNEDDWEKKGI